MAKFAVAIPTYQEVDNISLLTAAVDTAATLQGIELLLINADNNSPDGTSDAFMATKTMNEKHAIRTKGVGKGRNMLAVLEFVADSEIEYCFFIDGDITSFEPDWLTKHYEQYNQGADYVTPMYKRKFIEGNGTNHFAYPLMRTIMQGAAPRQPIAGDIGVSHKLAKYLLTKPTNNEVLGYGIDLFITMHALTMGGVCNEIRLNEKVHKPSFGNMIPIFEQMASAYFHARTSLPPTRSSFNPIMDATGFLPAQPITEEAISERTERARSMLADTLPEWRDRLKEALDLGLLPSDAWIEILAEAHTREDSIDSRTLAMALTPFYLLRALSYLKAHTKPDTAFAEIEQQAKLFSQHLSTTHR